MGKKVNINKRDYQLCKYGVNHHFFSKAQLIEAVNEKTEKNDAKSLLEILVDRKYLTEEKKSRIIALHEESIPDKKNSKIRITEPEIIVIGIADTF